jgi:hypothetical protein
VKKRGLTAPHGSTTRYGHGCLCDPCRQGAAERYRARRDNPIPDHIPHGASRYANWGCKCDVCLTAGREYQNRARRERRALRRAMKQGATTATSPTTAAATATTERNAA